MATSMRHLPLYLLPDRVSGLFAFIRSRELEGTLDRGKELGAWGATDLRVRFGWGTPSESAVEGKGLHLKWPPSLPPEVDDAARVNRIGAYRRVRTARECAEFLRRLRPVQGGFTITGEWLSEETVKSGRVPFDPNFPLIGSHAFSFTGVDEDASELEFDNTFWGRGWGDHGYGRMSFDYFDHHLVEAYVIDGVGFSLAGQTGELLGTPLSLPGSSHGMVMYGAADDSVRYGWAMFTEENEAINIDDFYVRPEYRRRGWGQRIWRQLVEMSQLYRKPLRLWVPFADCEPDHLDFLRRFFGVRGYALLESSVKWAGCEVRPGPMPPSTPTVAMPERPALALPTAFKAMTAALAMAAQTPSEPQGSGSNQPGVIERGHVGLSEATVRLLYELDSLASLRNGWNGYYAEGPSVGAIQNAKSLVIEAGRFATVPERVEPSAMGGVGVTFAAGTREVAVEFYNNGTAHALFADDDTGDMNTRSVSIDPAGYRELIDEVRQFLHVG